MKAVNNKLKTIIICWAAVYLLRLVPVAGTWDNLSAVTILVLTTGTAIFLVGWVIGLWFSSGAAGGAPEQINPNIVVWCSCIAMLGALLLTYEFTINRGYGFAMNVNSIRVAEVNASKAGRDSSPLGGLSRLMMPALFIAWIVYQRVPKPRPRLVRFALYAATILTFYAQAKFEGGRFFFVALFLAALIANPDTLSRKYRGRVFLFYVFGAVLFAFVLFVFLDRALARDGSLNESFIGFMAGFPITLHEGLGWGRSETVQSLYFATSMLWVYITSATNDLDLLLNGDVKEHALGAFQFPQFWKGLSALTGIGNQFTEFSLQRPGVYVTSFGGWFVDFGHWGIILGTFMIGMFSSMALAAHFRKQTGALALLAPLFFVICVFIPIHSIITTVWPAVTYALIFGTFRQRSRSGTGNDVPKEPIAYRAVSRAHRDRRYPPIGRYTDGYGTMKSPPLSNMRRPKFF